MDLGGFVELQPENRKKLANTLEERLARGSCDSADEARGFVLRVALDDTLSGKAVFAAARDLVERESCQGLKLVYCVRVVSEPSDTIGRDREQTETKMPPRA